MHKEIEEARALIRIIQELDESPEFVTEKATDLFNSVTAILALFDRMQQEPGILFTEHFIGGKWVPENGTMNPQMGGDKKRIARYRRELEDK